MWHHRTFHDACGVFREWRTYHRRTWQDEMVRKYYGLYTRADGLDVF